MRPVQPCRPRPARQIFDGSKGEAMMGHPYIGARQSIKDTAEAYLRFGLKLKMS